MDVVALRRQGRSIVEIAAETGYHPATISNPVVAGAILDRLMHRAVVFNIRGPSWRIREHHALATATDHDTTDSPSRRHR